MQKHSAMKCILLSCIMQISLKTERILMATTQQPAPRQALIYKQAFYFSNKSYS